MMVANSYIILSDFELRHSVECEYDFLGFCYEKNVFFNIIDTKFNVIRQKLWTLLHHKCGSSNVVFAFDTASFLCRQSDFFNEKKRIRSFSIFLYVIRPKVRAKCHNLDFFGNEQKRRTSAKRPHFRIDTTWSWSRQFWYFFFWYFSKPKFHTRTELPVPIDR